MPFLRVANLMPHLKNEKLILDKGESGLFLPLLRRFCIIFATQFYH